VTAPLITQADAQKVLTDYLYATAPTLSLPTLDLPDPWSVGTVVQPGVTPTKAIRVRTIGGVDEQYVADRPRLDVRVWGDGTYLTESDTARTARILLAHLRRDLRATVVADPIALPDPADGSKTHVIFTVELLLRGDQS